MADSFDARTVRRELSAAPYQGRRFRFQSLERDTVLAAIAEDPPAGPEELRGVLLREHAWRQREASKRDRPA